MESVQPKLYSKFRLIVKSLKVTFAIVAAFLAFEMLMSSCSKDDNGTDEKTVVINELMPLNSATVTDQDDEYDDWIELYNNSEATIDLSGYYLSDNDNYLTKWRFPDGTTIEGKGYLIVWADNDTLQTGLHTCYKLSADGEEVVLSKPNKTVIDEVKYSGQTLELSYSRIPSGTGSFSWQTATYNTENVKTLK